MNTSWWLLAGTLIVLCSSSGDAADLGKLELIDVARIPGAGELGWVEVERRRGALGWQCGDLRSKDDHLRAVARLVRAAPEAIDGLSGFDRLGHHLINRMTYYSQRGVPRLGGRGRTFPWRDWLRETLENINALADESRMPQATKEAALRNWVACHLHVTEAEGALRLQLPARAK
ncbi:MAG: hypothetical protein OXN89_08450 [Bryobacterales bacterium]|nr:hypothetical protein [Bryobacterales bacterium]